VGNGVGDGEAKLAPPLLLDCNKLRVARSLQRLCPRVLRNVVNGGLNEVGLDEIRGTEPDPRLTVRIFFLSQAGRRHGESR
jgi:hypothetical protein